MLRPRYVRCSMMKTPCARQMHRVRFRRLAQLAKYMSWAATSSWANWHRECTTAPVVQQCDVQGSEPMPAEPVNAGRPCAMDALNGRSVPSACNTIASAPSVLE